MKILITLIALLFALTVKAADRFPVYLYAAHGANGLTSEQVVLLFSQAKQQIRDELGIELYIKKFRQGPNPFDYGLDRRIEALNKWVKHSKTSGLRPRKSLHLIITNPIAVNGQYWLAGYANGTCFAGRKLSVAVVSAEMFNHLGEPRFGHSIVALIHEIGHLLGSPHTVGHSIMNEDAMSLLGTGELHFSTASYNAIRDCQHLPF